jgi:O-antigen/teichoic acid export membrane protein
MSTHSVFFKNALANLGRGGAAGLVALVLPPLLVRHMRATDYAVWVLVLQVGAYVNYLDFGLQTAIGRYVAFANEKHDREQRDTVFSTAFAALAGACLLSIVLLLAATAGVRLIFPSLPTDSVSMMRWAMVILGVSVALGLPASAWNGVFLGLQRNEIPAITIGGARIVSAVGIVIAAFTGKSVVTMSAIMAGTYLASYGVQYLAARRVVPDLRFELAQVRRATASELFSYCLGLTVMSFSMLLITGLDLILVGRFEFAALTPYSVAAGIIMFLSGGLSAVLNVMMPHAAALHAREEPEVLGRLVINATRVAVVLLLLSGIPLLMYAGPLLKVWIGQRFGAAGQPILTTLLLANVIRLLGLPYAIVLIAAGQQRLTKISPLTEGVSNFIASVLLGAMVGAIGVALGTLVGSMLSVASHFLYSMPRTNPVIRFSRGMWLWSGVLVPMLCSLPLLTSAGLTLTGSAALAQRLWLFIPAFIVSAALSALFLQSHGLLHRSVSESQPLDSRETALK